MKLAIGTAQFGLDYGVANLTGKTSAEEVTKILDYAHQRGVLSIDTAISYGDAENILGKYGVRDWQIVTKLPPSDSCESSANKIICDSLKRLCVDSLDGVLMHRANDLFDEKGSDAYKQLLNLKEKGVIKKIGISIYDPTLLDIVLNRFEIDIVQAPFNVLDRRILNTGWMSRLKEKGIELQVRSIFLQGLLLMEPENRPKIFRKWQKVWSKWDKHISITKKSRLEACLQWVMSFYEIDKIIVGIDCLEQLEKIMNTPPVSKVIQPLDVECNDPLLLDPFNWQRIEAQA